MSFNMGGMNPNVMQQLASGQMPPAGYNSPDVRQFTRQIPPEQFQQYTRQAMGQVPSQEYADHVTPGVGMLGSLAGTLLGHLTGGGGNAQGMANQMGLCTSDPQQMDANDVARMSQYARTRTTPARSPPRRRSTRTSRT